MKFLLPLVPSEGFLTFGRLAYAIPDIAQTPRYLPFDLWQNQSRFTQNLPKVRDGKAVRKVRKRKSLRSQTKDPHPALSQRRRRAREQTCIRFFLRLPSAVSNSNLRKRSYTEGYLFEKQKICFVDYYLDPSEDAVPLKCYLSVETDR